MVVEMGLDQFNQLDAKLSAIAEKTGRIELSTALQAQEAKRVGEQLATLNGRVGESEKRLSALEMAAIEVRGAWKVIIGLASAIGAIASWAIQQLLHK
jgi:succinyl-CoA synthetase alpha subunit